MIRNFPKDAELKIADQTITVDAAGAVSASPVYKNLGANYKSLGLISAFIEAGENAASAYVGYTFELQFSNATNFSTLTGKTTHVMDVTNHVTGQVYDMTSEVKGRYVRLYTDVVGGAGNMPIVAYLSNSYNQ